MTQLVDDRLSCPSLHRPGRQSLSGTRRR
jgi:hypothetical protein